MTKSLQRTILLSQFFMLLALEITNPFLPLLIASISHQSKEIIIFYSTCSLLLPMIVNMLMAPLWGMAADRYGYKPMLMRAAWALVITQASMMVVDSVVGILLIRIFQGAFAGYILAMQTYAVNLSEWAQKSRQLSRLQAAKGIATTVAGFAGGLVLTWTNYQGLYSLATFICLITTLVMHYQLPSTQTTRQPSHFKKLKQPLPKISGPLSFLCLLITITQLIRFLPDPIFSLFLNEHYPDNPLMIGFLYSLPAVGMLCSAEWCGRQFDRCRNNPLQVNQYLLAYSVLGLFVMIAHAFAENMYLFACMRIAWGIVLSALLPALFSLLSDRIQATGSALGLANAFAKLGNIIGIVLGGGIANWVTFHTFFLIIAAIYGGFALLVITYPLFTFKQAVFSSNSLSEKL